MTRSSLQRRSPLHGKRGFHPGRAAAPPIAETPSPTTLPTPPTPTPPAGAKDKNKPATPVATDDPGLIPGILSGILSPVIGSTTSKSSSASSSTTSVSATTSRVTTSSLQTTSVPAVKSTTPHVVVQTATIVSSSTTIPIGTPSETAAQVSNGISAITVIGGIGGALVATILLTVLVGFVLRRWRRNRSGDNAFDTNRFRQSGVLLDETDDNTHDPPRPPSMIERRNAASPPAAYPYLDEPPLSANEHPQSFAQFGAIPQHLSFAAGNQFGGSGGAPAMHYGANSYAMDNGQGAYSGPGENLGFGAPPVPGIHGPGAYAPYGVDPRYPQSQRYPLPKQYQYQNQQPQQGFGQGPAVDTPTSPTSENVNLANPFSPLRFPKKLGSIEGSGSVSVSNTPTSPSSPPPPTSSSGATPFVTRHQSHEVPPPIYTNNGGYADVQRDVKVSPVLLNVVNGNSDTAVPPTDTTTTTMAESKGPVSEPPRPLTVYGDDDVYGGM